MLSENVMGLILMLNFDGESLDECINSYFKTEDIDCECRRCNTKTVETLTKIKTFPKLLIIQLKRFSFTSTAVKINLPLSFNRTLKISGNTEQYQLKFFICHEGPSVNSGHYTTYLPNEDETYTKVNDQSIHYNIKMNTSIKESVYLLGYEKICKKNNVYDSKVTLFYCKFIES